MVVTFQGYKQTSSIDFRINLFPNLRRNKEAIFVIDCEVMFTKEYRHQRLGFLPT